MILNKYWLFFPTSIQHNTNELLLESIPLVNSLFNILGNIKSTYLQTM